MIPPAVRPLILVVALVACTLAADAPADPIAQAVRDLGDDRYRVREEAVERLVAAGSAAVPALRQALLSDDAEVVARARRTLERIVIGAQPDASKALTDLLARARRGGPETWESVVPALLDLGPVGLEAARKLELLLPQGGPPERAAQLAALIDAEGWRVAPQLLLDGQPDAAERLLAKAAPLGSGSDPPAPRAYAFALGHTGNLSQALPVWQKRLAAGGADAEAVAAVVAHLARAAGDRALALTAASQSDRPLLLEAARFDAGEWAALAENLPADVSELAGIDNQPIVHASLRVIYYELAGETAAAQEATRELVKLVEGARGTAPWMIFRGLLLAGRTKEALKLAERLNGEDVQSARLEVVAHLDRWDELPALLAAGPPRGALGDMARIRVLSRLGDWASVRQLAAELPPPRGASRYYVYQIQDQIDTLLSLGLIDAARRQAAAGLTARMPPGELFEKLHPQATLAAEAWWLCLRAADDTRPATETVTLLPELLGEALNRPGNVARLDAALAYARKQPGPTKAKLLAGLAEACDLAGRGPQATRLFAEARQSDESLLAPLKAGDVAFERGQWAEAVIQYTEAVRREPRQPLPRWRLGLAQTRQGGELAEAGRRNRDLAHAITLADEDARSNFLEELIKRSHDGDEVGEACRLERWALVRHSLPSSNRARNAAVALGADPLAIADRLEAAGMTQRFLIRMVRTNSYFRRPEAYAAVLQRLHTDRARGLLAKGDYDGMNREIEQARSLGPTQPRLATHLVPELERLGRKDDADRQYRKPAELLATAVERFPASGVYHQHLAWLNARCRRDLPAAVVHGRRAVEIEPHNPAAHEALAEALFQTGEREAALAAMDRAILLEPRNAAFRKQRERIRAGDAAAPLPDGR